MKKFAVIGFGGQGHWHYWTTENSECVTFAGLYDIDEAVRNKAKEEGLFVYDSVQAIFDDKSIDIVVIATPNDVHEELCVGALLSGHNVVCEKPVTLSVESFDRIIDAAEKSGKIFSVHQNRRWDKEFIAMKHIVEDKLCGNTLRIETRVHGSRGIPGDWRQEKKYGGGMIYDWGVHLIDQVMNIFPQQIVEIDCATTHFTNSEVDDGFRLEMVFCDGLTAFIEVGTYNFLKLPRFYLQCSQGTCIIPDWNENVTVKRLKKWEEENVKPVMTSAGITKTMAPRDDSSSELYEIKLPDSDVHDFYRDLCLAIDGKKEQAVKNSEVRRVLQVIEAAFKSDELRQRLKVEI